MQTLVRRSAIVAEVRTLLLSGDPVEREAARVDAVDVELLLVGAVGVLAWMAIRVNRGPFCRRVTECGAAYLVSQR